MMMWLFPGHSAANSREENESRLWFLNSNRSLSWVGPKCDMPPDKIKDGWLIPATISSNTAMISLPAGSRVVHSHFKKGRSGTNRHF